MYRRCVRSKRFEPRVKNICLSRRGARYPKNDDKKIPKNTYAAAEGRLCDSQYGGSVAKDAAAAKTGELAYRNDSSEPAIRRGRRETLTGRHRHHGRRTADDTTRAAAARNHRIRHTHTHGNADSVKKKKCTLRG